MYLINIRFLLTDDSMIVYPSISKPGISKVVSTASKVIEKSVARLSTSLLNVVYFSILRCLNAPEMSIWDLYVV